MGGANGRPAGGNVAVPACSGSGLRTVVPVRRKHALRIALRIVVLAVPQRPDESGESEKPEPQRHRDEQGKHQHGRTSYFRRSAFSDTVRDEVDMASAAMSGVARPAMATGTATTL